MKIIALRKVSEWHICQWEGELDDSRSLYAKVRHDRLSVGVVGGNYAMAMRTALSFPCIDTFLRRTDWDAPYLTDDLLRHLGRMFDVSSLDSEEIERSYHEAA